MVDVYSGEVTSEQYKYHDVYTGLTSWLEVDGSNINDINRYSLRNSMTIIPQEPVSEGRIRSAFS